MKTETGNKILAYIKEKNGISPKELILYTKISAPALFRQLKKLTARNLITKIGKPPKVKYHIVENLEPAVIKLSNYGNVLSSRADAREAYLAAKAYSLPKNPTQKVKIDFSGVDVLGPGWADEFLTPIKKEFGDHLILLPSNNATVKSTLEFLEEIK